MTANDTSIIFNPGAPNLAKEFRDPFVKAIREHVSTLVLNEAEAKCLTECDLERAIIDSLLSLADTVALTKGNRGSIVARQNEVYEIKAKSVKVVDTIGAGDAFAAGFIHGLAAGWDLRTAAELATTIAGKVVGGYGARVDYSV